MIGKRNPLTGDTHYTIPIDRYEKKFRIGRGFYFNRPDYRYGFFIEREPWAHILKIGFGSNFIYVGWIG